MNIVYLSLGSNEGNRERWLALAIAAIAKRVGSVVSRSSIYETDAWGMEEQPSFLNMALSVLTTYSAKDVLKEIQEVEMELGRQRTVKWGQRTLDIDILLYNEDLIDDEQLVIPHPYLQKRRFTLEPLHEIAPDLIHPLLKVTIAKLLEECQDRLEAKKLPDDNTQEYRPDEHI